MYTLYTRPGSGGFVAEAVLALAGAPFERVNISKAVEPNPDFLAISPLGQVPVLTLPDGTSLTESAAICTLIAERHPEAALAPAPGSPTRADFLRWMAFMSSALYPAVLRFYYAQRYTADPEGVKAVKDAAAAELDRGFAIVDRALEGRNWLVGDAFSVADIYLLMMASWHPQAEKARATWLNIERLCAAQRDNPVIKDLNARHEMW